MLFPAWQASPVQVQSLKTVSRLKLKELAVLIFMQRQIIPKSRTERDWGGFLQLTLLGCLPVHFQRRCQFVFGLCTTPPERHSFAQLLQTPQPLSPLEIHLFAQLQPQAKALELKITVLLGRLMKKTY